MQLRKDMIAASRTKFATGNPEQDLHNYRTLRKTVDHLLGLLKDGE